jgi:hypothetical protein
LPTIESIALERIGVHSLNNWLTSDLIDAFRRDLESLTAVVGSHGPLELPDSSKTGRSSAKSSGAGSNATPQERDGAISQAVLARFAADLLRIKPLLSISDSDRTPSRSESNPSEIPALDIGALKSLGHQFDDVLSNVRAMAAAAHARIRREWADDPRLCDGSVLGPLAVRYKEVRLTNALAWLMKPHSQSTLQAALLAATIGLVLKRNVSMADVANWSVVAEEPFDEEDDQGRIDIFAKGILDQHVYQIAIEAKVDAPEGHRQLQRYYSMLTSRAEKIRKDHETKTCVVF